MVLIILCYLLGIAMLILGFTSHMSEGFTFGIILILCAFMWHYKEIMAKRNKK
ncbi:MAG: hypothetical protein IJO78_00600 [Erysipelotrichaceae bacterium]|nr:hypothetical protein [Erysipelotrichaceae bacterium]